MKHKLVTLVLAIAVISGLVIAGCAKPATPTSPEEILIGCNAPLTGMHAGFGEGGVWGERAAVDDINKLGGIYVEEYGRKIPVRLVVVDNESDAAKAGTLEEDLILREKVHFLVDPNQPIDLAIPEATAVERHNIVRVSGGTPMEPWLGVRREAKPVWEHSWTFTFSIATPAPEGSIWDKPGYTIKDIWFDVLDLVAAQTNGVAGVFASDEPDGRGWYALFPVMLEDEGYDVVGIDRNLGLFPTDTTDFSSIIKDWMDNDVEILWGNCPGPLFGTMWRQAHTLGFEPKVVFAGRAALYYTDVSAWGGDLPWGVGIETFWDAAWGDSPGIGGTTAMSLYERWVEDTGKPLDPGTGWGYHGVQIMADAIERAGSLDADKVQQALGETDMTTISSPRVMFDEENSCRMPLAFGQWQKTDKPWVWECPIVYSKHDFIPASDELIFPIPYE
jgi:branched-chain amino acid transport system substrate-binding protein